MNMISEATDYMHFRDLLEDEEKRVREVARRFVNQQVMPITDKHVQEETFPAHLIPMIGALGGGLTLLEEYGCAGLSKVAVYAYEGTQDMHILPVGREVTGIAAYR